MIAQSDGGLLERVLAHSRRRVERLKLQRPLESLWAEPLYARVPRGFSRAGWIGEVRFATPPAGLLDPACPPSAEEAVRRARGFAAEGAAGLSVVVERHFFAGDPGHAQAVRAALPNAPLLVRDAFVDVYQLELARAAGADAVAALPVGGEAALQALAREAHALGLEIVLDVEDRVRREGPR